MDLTIEKMTEADFDVLYQWYKDPAYASFFRHTPENLTRDVLSILMTATGVVFKASTPDKNMAGVAFVSIYPKTHIGDVGIIVDKVCRKRGIAKSLATQIVKYMFTEGTVNRITMHVSEPGILAALKRSGFFEECRMYKNAFYDGRLHTESRMVLTKDFYKRLTTGV